MLDPVWIWPIIRERSQERAPIALCARDDQGKLTVSRTCAYESISSTNAVGPRNGCLGVRTERVAG